MHIENDCLVNVRIILLYKLRNYKYNMKYSKQVECNMYDSG